MRLTKIPPYYPPSRYKTTNEDLIIDYENQKIVSLPSIVTTNSNGRILNHHLAPRSVKDEILNEAENALLGKPQTTTESSGVHPGILYGGPAGGILAPIAFWFYKLFKKKRKKKKQRKNKHLVESDEENSEEESEQENITSNITSAVSAQVSNAGNSVMNHIKGKIADTSSSLVEDFKAQAIAQEEQMLDNIKTTILEQEQAMMLNIKQQIACTQTNLVNELKQKFALIRKNETDSAEITKGYSTSDDERQEEKIVKNECKTENEIKVTIIQPDQEKTSEYRDLNDVEKEMLTKKESSFFNKIIHTILPSRIFKHTSDQLDSKQTEEDAVIDIKLQIESNEAKVKETCKNVVEIESKSEELISSQKTLKGPGDNHTKETDKYVTSNVKQLVRDESATGLENKVSIPLNSLEHTYTDNTMNENMLNQSMEETSIVHESKLTINARESIETTEKLEEETKSKNEISINIEQQESNERIVELQKTSQETKVVEEHVVCANQDEDRSISSKDSTMLNKIKHKVSIPLHFLKHTHKATNYTTQTESENDHLNPDHDVTSIGVAGIQRTSPIPIPAHKTEPSHSGELNSESSSGKDNEEDQSFLEKIKNSVPYLPFNFSGIPSRVMTYIETKKHSDRNNEAVSTQPSEGKVLNEDTASPTPILSADPKDNKENRHVQFSTESNVSKTTSIRKWIVLDHTNEEWPSHLPRRISTNDAKPDSREEQNSDEDIKPPMIKWLQLVEEDVNATWPNHLPKNLHGVNGSPNTINDQMKNKHGGKHMRKKTTQFSPDDSESPEEEEHDWRKRLSRNLLLKPIDNDNDDRKESIVSTMSEFSTTSSIDSTSSGTIESKDSLPTFKLPKFETKLKKKRKERLKSLDSGIHHYYGEYIPIEFPTEDSGEKESCSDYLDSRDNSERVVKSGSQTTLKLNEQREKINLSEEVGDNLQKSEGSSSENSREEIISVISTTEIINTEERITYTPSAPFQDQNGEGYYEGYMVSLEHQKIQ